MKFDFVIGNPPYQEEDGGAQASARPVYQHFVEQAKEVSDRSFCIVMPARWYAGGRGLDDFRDMMLNDQHIALLYDYPNTDECFRAVNIRGGVCIVLWSKNYNNTENLVKVITCEDGVEHSAYRPLKYRDLNIFVRYSDAVSILDKVITTASSVMTDDVSPLRPFGFRGYFAKDARFRKSSVGLSNPVKCIGKGKAEGFVEQSEITVHVEWVWKWKVFIPRANNIGTELNDDNLNSFVGEPGSICTESYLVIGADLDLTESEAYALSKYYKTRFVRFLHSMAKSSQDATAKTHRFIPRLDFSDNSDIDWSQSIADIGRQLYRKYGLSDEEIAFIESHVKEMT